MVKDLIETRDIIMICGGPKVLTEIRDMLEAQGMVHGTMKIPDILYKNVHL